jgi:hypothetical protein
LAAPVKWLVIPPSIRRCRLEPVFQNSLIDSTLETDDR